MEGGVAPVAQSFGDVDFDTVASGFRDAGGGQNGRDTILSQSSRAVVGSWYEQIRVAPKCTAGHQIILSCSVLRCAGIKGKDKLNGGKNEKRVGKI